MTNYLSLFMNSIIHINSLYLAYSKDPASEEKADAFKVALGDYAKSIAHRYSEAEDPKSAWGELYLFMWDYAQDYTGSYFIEDLNDEVRRHFGMYRR